MIRFLSHPYLVALVLPSPVLQILNLFRQLGPYGRTHSPTHAWRARHLAGDSFLPARNDFPRTRRGGEKRVPVTSSVDAGEFRPDAPRCTHAVEGIKGPRADPSSPRLGVSRFRQSWVLLAYGR